MNEPQFSGSEPQDKPLGVDNWETLFPKDHMTAAEFDNGHGGYRDFNAKVARVCLRETYDQETRQKVDKPIIRFTALNGRALSKFMFLNHEISEAMAKITGEKDPNKWVGVTVNLYIFKGRNTPRGKKDVPRIRPAAGAAAAGERQQSDEAPEQQHHAQGHPGNDDIPF